MKICPLKFASSFSGVCNELINIHNREYISSKPHLVISEEDHMDSTTSTPPINQIVDEPMTDAHEIIDNAQEIIDNVPEVIINEPIAVEETENVRSVANAPPTTPTLNMDTELNIEGTNKSPVKGNGATPTSVSEASERPYGETSSRAHISKFGSPSTCQDTTFPNFDMPDFPDTNILNDSAEKGVWFNVSLSTLSYNLIRRILFHFLSA